MSNDTKISIAPSLGSMLLVAFIVLKLCGVITWSWWWVMSPLWIPLAILLGFAVVVGIAFVLYQMFKR